MWTKITKIYHNIEVVKKKNYIKTLIVSEINQITSLI